MVPLWMLQVPDQLPWCYKDPASLPAAGKRMSAPELVHIIDTVSLVEEQIGGKGVTLSSTCS